jgi:hypothetical protein
MALIAKNNGGADFKRLPSGAHFAVCNMIVDCGLQEGYSGKPQHKIYVRWECPDETVEFTKKGESKPTTGPMTIGRFYTLSLSDKAALRHDLENWRGQPFTKEELDGFDVFKVLGKACQLMVVHEESGGKTYANVKAIMGLSKDQRVRAKEYRAANELIGFSLDAPDRRAYERLPEWLREKIDKRLPPPEEANVSVPDAEHRDFDDDIPF